jgi:Icc-related predicted phosphoesterase
MLAVSDIHGAYSALGRLASGGETILILGDLVNLTDYRTGEGAVASTIGLEPARDAAEARGRGDFKRMRSIWQEAAEGRDDLRNSIGEVIDVQYQQMRDALSGGNGYVIHGNVDRPDRLNEFLPSGFEFVHGVRREIAGRTFGFVGGGVTTPMNASGEVSDAEMNDLLAGIGPVDILCTHVPPAVDPLRTDVVTGRVERSSEPILRYVLEHQPALHLFGDVHQPQATRWRLGETRCVNVGYFRATGRAYRLDLA